MQFCNAGVCVCVRALLARKDPDLMSVTTVTMTATATSNTTPPMAPPIAAPSDKDGLTPMGTDG